MSRSPWVAALVVLAACGGSAPAPGWMAALDDTRGLAALSIPGTHDSGAMLEPIAGVAKTQELTFGKQLEIGIRYFDVRCRHVADAFQIYHGPVDEEQRFDDVLAAMFAFLDDHPTETLIVSIKEEGDADQVTRSFEATFAAYAAQALDRWYLGPTVPTLGEARGKLVLLRRFPAAVTLGVDASAWADNTTFSLASGAATLRIQDAYLANDHDAKWQAITALFAEAAAGDPATLFLDYTSGYEKPSVLPNIPHVATDINQRLDGYLTDPAHAQAHLGVVVMDFATARRAQLIVATNSPPAP